MRGILGAKSSLAPHKVEMEHTNDQELSKKIALDRSSGGIPQLLHCPQENEKRFGEVMKIAIKGRQMMSLCYNLEISYKIMAIAAKSQKVSRKENPNTAK